MTVLDATGRSVLAGSTDLAHGSVSTNLRIPPEKAAPTHTSFAGHSAL